MNQPRSALSVILAVVVSGNFFLACGATGPDETGGDLLTAQDPSSAHLEDPAAMSAPMQGNAPAVPGGDTTNDTLVASDDPTGAAATTESEPVIMNNDETAATGGAGGTAVVVVTPPVVVATPPVAAVIPPAAPAGTLVPLYTYPTHPSWTAIIAAKAKHPEVPVIAVVNPSNGPGPGISADYAAGIAKLRAAGIKVLGYVATGYAKRSEPLVKTDIDRWKSFYPGVTGIFFDEMANTAGLEDYYRRQTSYARSLGLNYTVGNPGADTAPAYVGVVDMILVYENSGLRPLSNWHDKYPRESFGIIPYAVASLDMNYIQQAKKTVGFIYMTDDVLNNPWDSLPAYFPELLAALAI